MKFFPSDFWCPYKRNDTQPKKDKKKVKEEPCTSLPVIIDPALMKTYYNEH